MICGTSCDPGGDGIVQHTRECETLRATTINKIFDHARMSSRSAFFQLLIPLMILPAPAPAPAVEGAKPREPLDIPLQTVVKTVESTEQTPWGEALAKTTYGFDEKESTVHFTRFTLASKSGPDAKNLGNIIEKFKNNYKCTAKKSKRTFRFDPSCEVSAQLAWEGLCASGGRYLNVQFIARERLRSRRDALDDADRAQFGAGCRRLNRPLPGRAK